MQMPSKTEARKTAAHPDSMEVAVLGAGCFWCVEAIFEELQGVESVTAGYAGGNVSFPTYKQVCTGATGHAEVAKIVFDPRVISYEDILEVFWTTHDPTTLNRQGYDVGDQYRSVIFYQDDAQKTIAEGSKKAVATQLWDAPIVTEISPLDEFYPADDYHQNYYTSNPEQAYCKAVINPKLEKFRKRFAHKLKGAAPRSSLEKVEKTDAEWRKELTDMQYRVLRGKETERPFTGIYWDSRQKGTYVCAGCGLPLFKSDTKFDAHCGWPSFYEALDKAHVKEVADNSHGMKRTELLCARCGGHLGHVFDDGPAPTGLRYCINSASLEFEGKEGEGKENKGEQNGAGAQE